MFTNLPDHITRFLESMVMSKCDTVDNEHNFFSNGIISCQIIRCCKCGKSLLFLLQEYLKLGQHCFLRRDFQPVLIPLPGIEPWPLASADAFAITYITTCQNIKKYE